jgi:hypothetical protein
MSDNRHSVKLTRGYTAPCLVDFNGATRRETLKSWTLSLAVISLVGLAEILIVSRLLPLAAQ